MTFVRKGELLGLLGGTAEMSGMQEKLDGGEEDGDRSEGATEDYGEPMECERADDIVDAWKSSYQH